MTLRISTLQILFLSLSAFSRPITDEDENNQRVDVSERIFQAYLESDESYRSNVVELDILLPPNHKNEDIGGRKRRAVFTSEQRIWPGGVVPYIFDAVLPLSQKGVDETKKAMRLIESETCIKFVERDPKSKFTYLNITRGNGACSSFVGRLDQIGQVVNLGAQCERVGVIAHELTHALGYLHEHTRHDRNEHVYINYTNVKPGFDVQFEKYNEAKIGPVGLQDIDYDLSSIMHYANFIFSKHVDPTTRRVPLKREFMTIYSLKEPLKILGSQTLSRSDVLRINKHYECKNPPTTTTTSTTTTKEITSTEAPTTVTKTVTEIFVTSNESTETLFVATSASPLTTSTNERLPESSSTAKPSLEVATSLPDEKTSSESTTDKNNSSDSKYQRSIVSRFVLLLALAIAELFGH